MARKWVLDTETKGTGATMVPLEKTLRKPAPTKEPFFVPPKARPRPEAPPEPRAPRRFRVVDLVSREVLADDADARATVEALRDVRSLVDVHISVWEPDLERWRLLTLDEEQAIWAQRYRAA
jgi:hypothetical protein